MGGLTRNTPWDDQSSGGWLKKHLFSIKTLSLIVLSVQTSTMVLLLRYSRTSTTSNQAPYIITTAVLLSEILKLGLSLGFLHIEAGKYINFHLKWFKVLLCTCITCICFCGACVGESLKVIHCCFQFILSCDYIGCSLSTFPWNSLWSAMKGLWFQSKLKIGVHEWPQKSAYSS